MLSFRVNPPASAEFIALVLNRAGFTAAFHERPDASETDPNVVMILRKDQVVGVEPDLWKRMMGEA
jgi:hypothetical protein